MNIKRPLLFLFTGLSFSILQLGPLSAQETDRVTGLVVSEGWQDV